MNGRPLISERTFLHIADLQAQAHQGYNPDSSIVTLLASAERALGQSRFLLESRRPDLAFVEYLRASELVCNVIPRHRDYVDLSIDQPERARKLGLLLRQVRDAAEQYEGIKGIIVNNNLRSGARPQEGGVMSGTSVGNGTGNGNSNSNGHVRTESAPTNGLGSGHAFASSGRVKPPPSPKPEKLHGRPLSTMGTNGDALTDRFARLRMPAPLDTSVPNVSSVHSSPLARIPSATDYGGRGSMDTISRVSTNGTARPQGPRSLPNDGQPLPLHVTIPNMPQEPQAAYSPARNMQTTGNIAAPRHSARSLAGPRRTSMISSSASYSAPNPSSSQSNDYFPQTTPNATNGRPPPPSTARRRSSNIPLEKSINPAKLYDILRFNTLLIDFRPRPSFDTGHINAPNILCIEPFLVRQGMSAEQLESNLVLSPESEQLLFAQRDEFDLVVYYDQDTEGENFLSRPRGEAEARMKYLHEALSEFNVEKPLHRPPMLLEGGVTAWCEFRGPEVLVKSSTAAVVSDQGSGLRRRPVATARPNLVANGQSELRVSKRRLRDYNPLDEEEEKSWRERARAESVVLPPTPGVGPQDDEQGDALRDVREEDEDPDQERAAGGAIQDFLTRFPDAGDLDRHAFAGVRPVRAPPEPPQKVPMYPSTPPSSYPPPPSSYPPPPSSYPPPPSSYPSVPARPAPAAPRMSYTGVSDRVVSATTPISRTVSATQPYVPSKQVLTNIRLPHTGLTNFGNTCYMNSCLQALSATLPLTLFFLDDGYKPGLQHENWKGSHGVMPDLYANLIRSLWKNDVQCIRPTTFSRFCARLNGRFGNGEQQDAKEFLDFLVDVLHEDLNPMWARTPLRDLTKAEEAKRERMPKPLVAQREWERYLHRDGSFINGLFGGQHASRLECRTCGFTSTKYETFLSISVEIPTTGRGGVTTLEDCLKSYCAEEVLTHDEVWKCPRCETQREASKRITLTRAPQYLVVHFKRFATGGSSGGAFSWRSSSTSARKIRTPVLFPLHNLDLGPYTLPAPSAAETASYAGYNAEDASMTPPYLYDAYAVVRHIGGTLQSGHYVTVARDRGRGWREYNDKTTREVREETVGGGEEAYIVFYERK